MVVEYGLPRTSYDNYQTSPDPCMSFKGVNGIFVLEVRIQKLTNLVVYVQENPNKIYVYES